jgi:hypothetical protein
MQDRLERLPCWFDHQADEHCLQGVYAPLLPLRIELWRWHIENIRPLLGVVKPEHMDTGSRHEDLESHTVALAKRMMKEREKPRQFLLPHGMSLRLLGCLSIFMEDNPSGIHHQSPWGIMELSVTGRSAVAILESDFRQGRPRRTRRKEE